MTGALAFAARELIVETSRNKRSGGVIALIERLGRLCGPKPGEERKPVRIVLDNGPVHTSKATRAALGQRSRWLAPAWLPKYAPELNDIERSWKTLKSQRLAHQTFQGADHLETAINKEISIMNANRKSHPLAKLRIAAWSLRKPSNRRKSSSAPKRPSGFDKKQLVLPGGIEPTTSPLPRECSTTELRQRSD